MDRLDGMMFVGRRAGGIACALLVAVVLARPARAAPVALDKDSAEVRLGRSALKILEDPGGELDLAQVTSPRLHRRFKPAAEDEPAFGFSSSAYWARFEVVNRQASAETFLLELSYPLLDRVDLYVRQPDGSFDHQRGGDHYPFGQRLVHHRNVIFPLKLLPGQITEVYLRVATTSSVQIPVVIWSRHAFQRKDHTEQLLLGLYYGLVLVMLFYNLFLYVSIRERTYLLFVIFLGSYGVTQAALNGLAFEFLWPNAIWWANSCVPFFIGVTLVATLVFTRDFLQTRVTEPRMDRALRLLTWLYLAFSPLSLFLSYSAGIRVTVAGCVVVPLIITGTAIYALARGYRAARFFVLAWLAFFSGIVTHALLAYGVLPRNWLTDNFHQIGSAMQVVLLSFALGDRINLIKREKDEALGRALESERRSLEIERRSRETLQQEVDRQTEALRTANTRLQEVDRQKTLFFQNVSHELRSPLTVLLNPLERLLAANLSGPPGLDVKARLRAMERNAHRLLRLVNQLLDFARLESGRNEPSFERRDLVAFVQPIVDGFQAFAAARELRLELRAAEGVPEVYFDPEKLDTVACNLISNACKFTEPGGAVLVKVDTTDGQARVTVKDSGIGIPADQLERIFDRFHQADDSSRRRYQGTGIGLALARELAQVMGGAITVESDVGFGSTFTVRLPLGKDHIKDPARIRTRQENGEAEQQRLAQKSQHAAHALAGEVGLGAGEDEPEAAGSDKPRILVVEDSPDMRTVIAEICRADFRVTCVESAEEALTRLHAAAPDDLPVLVISDVMMPEMDGHELLARLRAAPATSSIPVMLLTAKAGPERRLEGLESGADEYLTKPFDSRELRARARNLVRLKQQERQLLALNRQMEKLNLELERQVRRKSREVQRARQLGRYLPPPVVDAVINRSEGAPTLGHQRLRLTVFRADLLGFEELTEALEPEELAERLNGYLSMMLRLSFEHGATVDHFVLGRVSGFFGAPESAGPDQDALRCGRMAVEMWERSRDLCLRWERSASASPSVAPVPVVVVHSGYATVGNFGSESHLDYTAVGKTILEANALLRASAAGVVCSQTTWSLLEGRLEGEQCGAVSLRYRAEPTPVYRLAGGARILTSTPARATQSDSGDGPARRSSPWRSLAQLEPGLLVAERYRLLDALGTGGMGSVYKARDEKLELDVALKLIRPDLLSDERRIKRLQEEVRLSRRVTHRNVARIYDIGDWEGCDFVSMEFLVGETLHQLVQRQKRLPLDETLAILAQLCAGLGAAHEAEVIHRDLKPSNVMLERGGRAVILDFGIARALTDGDSSSSGSYAFVGSPHWMAPEQVTGAAVDHRADIYSLGALAYEVLTGQTLFRGESAMAVALQQMSMTPTDPRKLRPDLPEGLATALERCLAKKPADRFQSAADVATALEALRREVAAS